MELKDLIYYKRKEQHLTTTQLAARVGVSHSTISRLERGEIHSIKHNKIVLLAKSLGVDAAEIMSIMEGRDALDRRGILKKFYSLSVDEQDEILAIIDYKLNKGKK